MTKFPVVRDLVVDRSRMFEALQARAGVDPARRHATSSAPARATPRSSSGALRAVALHDLRLLPRGVPATSNPHSAFIGPAAINQARLFNLHPTGKMHADERLEALMGEGGVADCGNAQNCVRVCPKEIPLTTSLADMMRQATKVSLVRWFKK